MCLRAAGRQILPTGEPLRFHHRLAASPTALKTFSAGRAATAKPLLAISIPRAIAAFLPLLSAALSPDTLRTKLVGYSSDILSCSGHQYRSKPATQAGGYT